MPGLVLTFAATTVCSHSGKATPAGAARVTIRNSPVVTLATQYAIVGCTYPAATSGAPPCATGSFVVGAARVTSLGSPLALVSSTSECKPNTPQPMIVTPGLSTVKAT